MNTVASQLRWVRAYLFPHIARYKWSLFAGMVISCGMAGLSYYNLQLIRRLFDERIYSTSFENFLVALLGIFGLVVVFNLLGWLQNWLNSTMIVNINRDMIERFYEEICGMPFLFFHTHSPGQLITLLLNDLTQVTPLIQMVFIDLVKNVLIIGIVLAYLYTTQWQVIALYGCLGIGYLVITNYFTARIKALIPEMQRVREGIHNKLIEYFQVINLLKIYDNEGVEKNKVNELNAVLARQNKKVILLDNTKSLLLELMVVSVLCAFVLVGYKLISGGLITAGKFVVILVASYLLNGYVRALFDIYGKMQQTRVYLDRLSATFRTEAARVGLHENKTAPRGDSVGAAVNSIVFDNVTFAYDKRNILENINCTFDTGVMTGITGESGHGKSTLLNLMLLLTQPSVGKVLINGVATEKLDPSSYRRQVSYLPQNSVLFNGTIADNIAFGETAAVREKMIQAAKMANIHDFITSLPKGYDSPITTGMSSISEGEKKRIEIARALYKESSIIILDEPTANLDLKNKIALMEVLRSVQGKIVIVVSHDMSVLEQCGRILMITAGRGVEVLPHYSSLQQYYLNDVHHAS